MTTPKKFGRPPDHAPAASMRSITFKADDETWTALTQLVHAASEGAARFHMGRLKSAVIRQAVIEAAQRLLMNKKES